MVIQKKTPGQPELSVIAKITVHTNIRTCMKMPHTIRVVKLPLKEFKSCLKYRYFIKHL